MGIRLHRSRGLALVVSIAAAAATLGVVSGSAGSLTPPDPNEVVQKVTICHRTNSNSNPYVINEPDASGDVNGHAGHVGSDDPGPVWNDTLKAQGIKWGDIIPPFKWSGGDFPGLNWTTEGQAIYKADCETPPPVEQAYGSLAVTKTVVLPTGTPVSALPTGFTVHVECDDDTSVDVTFPATGGAGTPATIEDIEAGSTCVITENDTNTFPAGTVVTYTPAGANSTGVVVEADTKVTVDVKNDFAGVPVQPGAAEVVVAKPGFTG